MGLMGSLIGGAVGFALGGPLGAVAGAVFGGMTGQRTRPMTGHERSQATYFISVFSMLAKMARADGVVTQQEIDLVRAAMRGEMQLDDRSEKAAIKIFQAAKESPIGFEAFAQQFADTFSDDPEVVHSMLDLLTRLAMADGELHPGERRLLERAVGIFRLDPRRAQHIFAQHGAMGAKSRGGAGSGARPSRAPAARKASYDVLGVDADASDTQIRSSYRKLVSEFHPDKIIAKGLPDEFVKFAETRFREIQEAYEEIKRERGMP